MANAWIRFKIYDALGIKSPSREFVKPNRVEYPPHFDIWGPHNPTAPPWYAARGPLEPWPSAAMAREARCLRRKIRARQRGMIALFRKLAGVDDGPFTYSMALAEITVRECLRRPLMSFGEAIRSGLRKQFREMTRPQ